MACSPGVPGGGFGFSLALPRPVSGQPDRVRLLLVVAVLKDVCHVVDPEPHVELAEVVGQIPHFPLRRYRVEVIDDGVGVPEEPADLLIGRRPVLEDRGHRGRQVVDALLVAVLPLAGRDIAVLEQDRVSGEAVPAGPGGHGVSRSARMARSWAAVISSAWIASAACGHAIQNGHASSSCRSSGAPGRADGGAAGDGPPALGADAFRALLRGHLGIIAGLDALHPFAAPRTFLHAGTDADRRGPGERRAAGCAVPAHRSSRSGTAIPSARARSGTIPARLAQVARHGAPDSRCPKHSMRPVGRAAASSRTRRKKHPQYGQGRDRTGRHCSASSIARTWRASSSRAPSSRSTRPYASSPAPPASLAPAASFGITLVRILIVLASDPPRPSCHSSRLPAPAA